MSIKFHFDWSDLFHDITSDLVVWFFDILNSDLICLLFYSFFQLFQDLSRIISKSSFFEHLDCLLLGFINTFVKAFLRFRKISESVFHFFNENFITIIKSSLTLFLTHIIPSIFNIRNSTFIDSIDIWADHCAIHVTIKSLVLKGFNFNWFSYSLSEIHDLVNKLRSEIIIRHFVKIL